MPFDDSPTDPDPRVSDYVGRRWTRARAAIVERDWPTYRNTNDICAELNAMPGEYIWKDQISTFAASVLKIRRPRDYMTSLGRSRGNASAGWATPARRAILLRDYPDKVPFRVIRERLLAVDRRPLPCNGTIGTYCQGVLCMTRSQRSWKFDAAPTEVAGQPYDPVVELPAAVVVAPPAPKSRPYVGLAFSIPHPVALVPEDVAHRSHLGRL